MADINLSGLLDQLISSGTSALGGYAQGSDMNPILKGLIGTVLGTPGSGTPPFQYGYLPGSQEEYAYKLAQWAAQQNKETGRVGQTQASQRDRMLQLLGKIGPRTQASFAPTAEETQLGQYGGNLREMLQGMYTQNTPEYKNRVDRLERERIAKTQNDLQQLVAQNQRAVARGGVGLLNPERQDQMIAHTLAQSQDTARDQANNQAMSDLAKTLTTGIQGFAPQGQLAEASRARQAGATNAANINDTATMQAQQGYDNALADVAGKYAATEPDPYNIKKQYFWSGTPGTAGQVGMGGTGTSTGATGNQSIANQLLSQLAKAGVSGLGNILGGAAGGVGNVLGNIGSGIASGAGDLWNWITGGSTPTADSAASMPGGDYMSQLNDYFGYGQDPMANSSASMPGGDYFSQLGNTPSYNFDYSAPDYSLGTGTGSTGFNLADWGNDLYSNW